MYTEKHTHSKWTQLGGRVLSKCETGSPVVVSLDLGNNIFLCKLLGRLVILLFQCLSFVLY